MRKCFFTSRILEVAGRDAAWLKQHLTGKGVPYRLNHVPNSTCWQIFLRDPHNVEIELNFETKNETVAS
jgi:hypothetical protein